MPSPGEQLPQDEILAYLRNLDARVSRLEAQLNVAGSRESAPSLPAVPDEEREENLEQQIGQNWFAKAGIVGIAVGIAFLLTFPYANIPPAIPSLVGYVLVGGIVFLSRLWKESYDQISRYLLGGGLLLLYFTTLRLSYFTPEPVITDGTIQLTVLVAVVVIAFVAALRRASPYLTSLAVFLGCLTGLLNGQPYVVGVVLTLLAAVAGYAYIIHRWPGVLLLATVMTYLTHLILAMNDPLRGTDLALVVGPEATLAFLLAYMTIFAAAALLGLKSNEETLIHPSVAVLNGGGAFSLLLLCTAVGLHGHVALWHAALSIVSLAFATAFWLRERSKYSTFVYAMLGYMALSVAIVDSFAMPDFFVWLCWESILVLVTAVWFRSRFIVVANFVIYLIVFIAYLISAGTVSLVSISFGVVALLSARVLNWQKEKLELKTEVMRNAYLGSALLFIPYALYHSLPPSLVSISWLLVALTYYLFSRLLGKNRKYRWMALLTTIMTIVYVFAVDLVGVDPTVRIISFLVLGTALLGISMIYTRRRAGLKASADERQRPPKGQ